MTEFLPRVSEIRSSDWMSFEEHVRKDLYSRDPIILANTIVGNHVKNYSKPPETNPETNPDTKMIFKSDDDITVLLQKLKSIDESYSILSQKYLSISEKVLEKVKELSRNLNESCTVELDCNFADRQTIIQLYDNMNSYIRDAQELTIRICSLLIESDNMENYGGQFYEIYNSWDVSKDKFKGITKRNTNSEYYIVNELLNEFSNINDNLVDFKKDTKKDTKKNIDKFLHLIKDDLSCSKKVIKKIINNFLDSMSSLIERWEGSLCKLRSTNTVYSLNKFSEGNFDEKESSYLSLDEDGNPKSFLTSIDDESTLSTDNIYQYTERL